jgi:hypothetical protein
MGLVLLSTKLLASTGYDGGEIKVWFLALFFSLYRTPNEIACNTFQGNTRIQ